jgi:hypothetical protein
MPHASGRTLGGAEGASMKSIVQTYNGYEHVRNAHRSAAHTRPNWPRVVAFVDMAFCVGFVFGAVLFRAINRTWGSRTGTIWVIAAVADLVIVGTVLLIRRKRVRA